jgi:hypothetical protein
MQFRKILYVALFILAILGVAQTLGSEKRTNYRTADLCDTRSKKMKFVLTSGNGEVKETFKVPVRYMWAKFEREGRLKTSLHLDAVLDTLEPGCFLSGDMVSKEEKLGLKLGINLRPPQEWESLLKQVHADTEKYRYEEITIAGYPDFTFKASKNRPEPKAGAEATYGYIPVYPRKDFNIPVYFRLECGLGMDMVTLNMCRIRFLYQKNKSISVTANFYSKELEDLDKVYAASIKLIDKLHVK